MRQALGDLEVSTRGEGFFDVTRQVASWLQGQGAQNGLLTILCRHTSASLTIQENADPDVLTDLKTALHRFAPQDGRYVHDAEGPDDMPAHIRTMLTSATLSVPVRGGRMHLGTWQGVYLIEHRARPHERRLSLHYLGD
ncbi:secondary thiamine-phosphate synthase enzyme YjbQ [Parvularcula dongshanensis]|uniref:secondary thiamine-phosphate synthase enzyme YjbQ n=1 Tax=Parvularcula dongshanensis TaxID=1173995 RepID=UPI0016081886|nr:secondary thiamine-phosphate synthase enzyme YjbQ [Parvularcula dongshanensis]